MVSRTRTRGFVPLLGKFTRTGKPGFAHLNAEFIRNAQQGISKETCFDLVGHPLQDNVFDLEKVVCRTEFVSGSHETASTTTVASGSCLPVGMLSYGPGHNTVIAGSSISALAARLAARTNPNRPIVDIPVFLFELKDIPRMIKQAGDAIHWVRNRAGGPPTASGMANANLAYQFGWAPLMSDLAKLLDFASHYEKKRSELANLFNKGGLRRNVNLEGSQSSTSVASYPYEGPNTPMTITGSYTRSMQYKAWGSIRWKPTLVPGGLRQPSDLDVLRTALGLDITLHTVWEALPWSWLFDYFSSIGDFLAAYRNTVPVTFSRICIMQYQKTVSVYTPVTITNGYSWAGATTTYERKRRTPNVQPTITGYMPFLSMRQLSILASLLIVRASPGSR